MGSVASIIRKDRKKDTILYLRLGSRSGKPQIILLRPRATPDDVRKIAGDLINTPSTNVRFRDAEGKLFILEEHNTSNTEETAYTCECVSVPRNAHDGAVIHECLSTTLL